MMIAHFIFIDLNAPMIGKLPLDVMYTTGDPLSIIKIDGR